MTLRGEQLEQTRLGAEAERTAAQAAHGAEQAAARQISETERAAAEVVSAGERDRQRLASGAEEARARVADAYAGGETVVTSSSSTINKKPFLVQGASAVAGGGVGIGGLFLKKVLDFTGLTGLAKGAWNAFAEATEGLPSWARVEKLADPHKKEK